MCTSMAVNYGAHVAHLSSNHSCANAAADTGVQPTDNHDHDHQRARAASLFRDAYFETLYRHIERSSTPLMDWDVFNSSPVE